MQLWDAVNVCSSQSRCRFILNKVKELKYPVKIRVTESLSLSLWAFFNTNTSSHNDLWSHNSLSKVSIRILSDFKEKCKSLWTLCQSDSNCRQRADLRVFVKRILDVLLLCWVTARLERLQSEALTFTRTHLSHYERWSITQAIITAQLFAFKEMREDHRRWCWVQQTLCLSMKP